MDKIRRLKKDEVEVLNEKIVDFEGVLYRYGFTLIMNK